MVLTPNFFFTKRCFGHLGVEIREKSHNGTAGGLTCTVSTIYQCLQMIILNITYITPIINMPFCYIYVYQKMCRHEQMCTDDGICDILNLS